MTSESQDPHQAQIIDALARLESARAGDGRLPDTILILRIERLTELLESLRLEHIALRADPTYQPSTLDSIDAIILRVAQSVDEFLDALHPPV